MLKGLFETDDLGNAFYSELSNILTSVEEVEISSDLKSFYEVNLISEQQSLKKIKFNNKIIHQSKLLNYFVEEKDISKIEKETNDLLKNILKDKKYIKYIDSKSKFPIIYLEIELDKLFDNLKKYKSLNRLSYQNEVRYIPVSEFPSTIRDLSFLVKDKNKLDELDKVIAGLDDSLLRDTFIFDYYVNQQKNYIKIGYRFVFQSSENTLTDIEINDLMKKIIKQSLSINSIEIPGLN